MRKAKCLEGREATEKVIYRCPKVVSLQQPEYTEGPKALENFEKMATAIFQTPKAGGRKTGKKSSKMASERKY